MEYFIVYVIGFIIACGVRGGIRDEMDGIGDMIVIVFWPLWLVVSLISKSVKFIYNIGYFFNKKS